MSLLLAGIVGISVGSFLNVCVARWPAGESVVSPRSRCPRCGHQITWYENIPVVSWVLLRAKCSGCGLPISAQYPLVELGVAGMWMLSFWYAGPTFTGFRLAVFVTLLFGILLTDLQAYEIPDGFTITGLVAGIVGAFGAIILSLGDWPFASLPDAVIGACAGAGLLAIVRWLAEVALKREAMGFGDVTMMAMVGAHVGPWRSVVTVFAGAFIGLATLKVLVPFFARRRAALAAASPEPPKAATGSPEAAAHSSHEPDDLPGEGMWGLPPIPFGVFLAPGAVLVLLWGDQLILWYSTAVGFQ